MSDWTECECETCGFNFMIKVDGEHLTKNTCCPECRKIVIRRV